MTEPRPSPTFPYLDRMFLTVVSIGLVLTLIVVGVVWRLDNRLERFEKSAAYRPPTPDAAVGQTVRAAGGVIYAPAYSHIYVQEGKPALLAVTLSVRNVSTSAPLFVDSIEYFDTEGRSVRRFLESPLTVPPLGAQKILVGESDTQGGAGASFLVRWSAGDAAIPKPLVETVMIGAAGGQGISFVSRGVDLSGP